MRTIIVIGLFAIMGILLTAGDIIKEDNKKSKEEIAVKLTYQFIERLKKDIPFTYEEECYYFGHIGTIPSIVLLRDLGYIDSAGKEIKARPKYSYLCELLRLNSKMILLENPTNTDYIVGVKYLLRLSKKSDLIPNKFYLNIICYQSQIISGNDVCSYGPIKTVIFNFKANNALKLDFPIIVNDQSLLDFLGFYYDEKDKDYHIKKEVLDKLEKHVKSIDETGAYGVKELNPTSTSTPVDKEKATASPELKGTFIDLGEGVKMEFVLIQPGSFMMGTDRNYGKDDEQPVHKVTIKEPFYLGKYEVTQEQWQTIMGSNPSKFKGAKNPVETVSWNDCQDFIAKLKKKVSGLRVYLPSEEQWEYACRAGSTTEYSFGDSDSTLGEYEWYNANSDGKPHPVGEKKPNSWGLYDMNGNVSEWGEGWYVKYPSDSSIDFTGGDALRRYRIIRGGSCLLVAKQSRSAFRSGLSPDSSAIFLGFRLAIGITENNGASLRK